MQFTVGKVLAVFAVRVCDWWRHCKVLCDVKFSQNSGKLSKISSHGAEPQRHQLIFLTVYILYGIWLTRTYFLAPRDKQILHRWLMILFRTESLANKVLLCWEDILPCISLTIIFTSIHPCSLVQIWFKHFSDGVRHKNLFLLSHYLASSVHSINV